MSSSSSSSSSSVPLFEKEYCDRKNTSNTLLCDALNLFGICGNIIVLDHFKDSTKITLNTIPMLLAHKFRPDQIYTANIGVKNGSFFPTLDSANIVAIAKNLGVHADEVDILSFLQRHGRIFEGCYLDMCCSFENTKPILLTFVGNHVDPSKECLIAFTVEMNRTSHREDKNSNNELIRDFVFGADFKRALPFTFCDPLIWINSSDKSNKMQFVIIKLTPAKFPHQSHMAFNPRDCSPCQPIFRMTGQPGVYEKGLVKQIGKPTIVVDWSSQPTTTSFVPWDEVCLVLPDCAKVVDEVLVLQHPLIDSEIVKTFHKRAYTGKVTRAYKLDDKKEDITFFVKYEDGDEEEMTAKEVFRHAKHNPKKVNREVKWLKRNCSVHTVRRRLRVRRLKKSV